MCISVSAGVQAAETGEASLETVLVTATRRETNLQETPLAISALSQATLDENHVTTLLDMRGLVPNLQFFSNGDHAVPLIFIRGLGTRNQTEAGDQGIAFYNDGVFSARSQGTTVMMYDLDRVEVLRGPQGTLFGRNSTGGAVSLHTAKPRLDGFDASGEIAAGSYSMLELRGMANVPITEKWAIRVAGAKDEQEGQTEFASGNPFGSSRKYGTVDLSSFRVSSLFEPTDDVSWHLVYENFRNRGTGDVASRDFEDRVNNATAAGNLDLDSDSIRTRLDFGFGDGYTLSYIGGYSEFSQAQMYGNEPQGDTRNTVDSTYEGTQHELQLTNPSEARFNYTAGLYYFEEENSIRFDMLHGSWGFTPQDQATVLSAFVQPARSLETQSAYAQGTFKFTDELRFTAGARYIDDTREDKGGRSIDCTFPLRGDLPSNIVRNAAALNGAQGCYYRQYNDMKGEWDKMTWMARGEYDLTDSVMMYLSYETGWKSGVLQDGKGYDDLVTPGGTLDVSRNNSLLQKPEEVNSIELGVKTDFSNWRLSTNVFYMDFTDMQITGAVIDPVTGQSTLVSTNAGSATIKGLELEASAGVFDGAGQLGATFAYLDATYDEFIGGSQNFGNANGRIWNDCALGVLPNGACVDNVFDFSGNSLPYAPEFQLTVQYSHEFPLPSGAAVVPRIRASYYDKMFLNWENLTDRPPGTLSETDPGDKEFGYQPAYTMLDAAIAFRSSTDQWTAEAFITNALDEAVKTEAFYNRPETFYSWGARRQVGVRLAYKYK
jgi:iron complex outermembrane recepter protein